MVTHNPTPVPSPVAGSDYYSAALEVFCEVWATLTRTCRKWSRVWNTKLQFLKMKDSLLRSCLCYLYLSAGETNRNLNL